jgi:hypothetical protein
MRDPVVFKTCPTCHRCWPTCEDFVGDPSLQVNGYMAVLGKPDEGLILLTHCATDCGTTVAVRAGELRCLYDGPEYPDCCAGMDVCERLCLEQDKLEECSAPCAMAWVRVVLQHLRRHERPGR